MVNSWLSLSPVLVRRSHRLQARTCGPGVIENALHRGKARAVFAVHQPW